MALTDAQKTALKADILANTDPAVIAALAAGDVGAIAAWYNQNRSPSYYIYKKFIAADEIRDLIDAQNIASMTSGDRERAVSLLSIRTARGFSGHNARDRSAWDDIFSTAAGDESQQAILANWSRLATNLEYLFRLSTGNGAAPATADTSGFEGQISYQEVGQALNS